MGNMKKIGVAPWEKSQILGQKYVKIYWKFSNFELECSNLAYTCLLAVENNLKNIFEKRIKMSAHNSVKVYALAHSQNIKKYWSNWPKKIFLLFKVTLLVILILHTKIDLLVKKWTLLSNLPKSTFYFASWGFQF